jgi:hypothetical protein
MLPHQRIGDISVSLVVYMRLMQKLLLLISKVGDEVKENKYRVHSNNDSDGGDADVNDENDAGDESTQQRMLTETFVVPLQKCNCFLKLTFHSTFTA